MRTREKLTLEEKFALALALIKRRQSLDEIRVQYRISHTTAYKIRNAFLEGGRAALSGERKLSHATDLEARVSALEALLGEGGRGSRDGDGNGGDGRSVRPRPPAGKPVERVKPPPEGVRAAADGQPRRVSK
jgi:hypothetical protein